MSTDSDGGRGLDELLESELRRRLGGLDGPSPGVGGAAYRTVTTARGKKMPILSSLATAASSKAAVGLATAALVVGGGSVAAAAATNSTNPAVWGRTVTAAVASCKSKLGDGQHGIGQCVSAAARKKGEEERAAHAASEAREDAGTPTPRTGGSASHPTPPAHPGGRPTGVPVGPPATLPPAAGGGGHPSPPVVPPTPHNP